VKPESICVHTAQGEFEAQLVKAFLQDRGVPCRFGGEALRKTHGLTLDGLGEVRIFVAQSDAGKARELLAQVASGELQIDEGDVEP